MTRLKAYNCRASQALGGGGTPGKVRDNGSCRGPPCKPGEGARETRGRGNGSIGTLRRGRKAAAAAGQAVAMHRAERPRRRRRRRRGWRCRGVSRRSRLRQRLQQRRQATWTVTGPRHRSAGLAAPAETAVEEVAVRDRYRRPIWSAGLQSFVLPWITPSGQAMRKDELRKEGCERLFGGQQSCGGGGEQAPSARGASCLIRLGDDLHEGSVREPQGLRTRIAYRFDAMLEARSNHWKSRGKRWARRRETLALSCGAFRRRRRCRPGGCGRQVSAAPLCICEEVWSEGWRWKVPAGNRIVAHNTVHTYTAGALPGPVPGGQSL